MSKGISSYKGILIASVLFVAILSIAVFALSGEDYGADIVVSGSGVNNTTIIDANTSVPMLLTVNFGVSNQSVVWINVTRFDWSEMGLNFSTQPLNDTDGKLNATDVFAWNASNINYTGAGENAFVNTTYDTAGNQLFFYVSAGIQGLYYINVTTLTNSTTGVYNFSSTPVQILADWTAPNQSVLNLSSVNNSWQDQYINRGGLGNYPLELTAWDNYSVRMNYTVYLYNGSDETVYTLISATQGINLTNDSALKIISLNLTNGTSWVWVSTTDNASKTTAGLNYSIRVDNSTPTAGTSNISTIDNTWVDKYINRGGAGNLPLAITGIDLYAPHVNLTIHYIDNTGAHTTVTENGSIANNTPTVFSAGGATGLNLTNGTNYIWVVVKDNGTTNWVAGTNYTIRIDNSTPEAGTSNISTINNTWISVNGTGNLPLNFTGIDNYAPHLNITIFLDNDTAVSAANVSVANNSNFNFSAGGVKGLNLTNGSHWIQIYVQDNGTTNALNGSRYRIHVDTFAPESATSNISAINNTWVSVNGTGNVPLTINLTDMYAAILSYSIWLDDARIYNADNNATNSTNISIGAGGLNLTNGTHNIYIEAEDNASFLKNSSMYTIHIDTLAPTGVSFAAGNITNETRLNVSSVQIWINATDNWSAVMNCSVWVNDTRKNATTSSATGLWNYTGGRNLTLTGLLNGANEIVIEVTDNASNKANSSAYIIVSDQASPSVSSITPDDTAQTIAISANVAVVFNESVKNASVTNTTFNLSTTAGVEVGHVINTADNVTFTLNPDSDLSYDTSYTIVIKYNSNLVGVKDLSGRALTANYSYTFTTGGTPQTGDSSSAGGGGAGSASAESIQTGIDKETPVGTVEMWAGQNALFESYDGVSHTVTVLSVIGSSQVKVRITSTLVEATLSVGVPKYLNLDDDAANDLKITLDSIVGGLATFTLELLDKGYAVTVTAEVPEAAPTDAAPTAAATATSTGDDAAPAADTGVAAAIPELPELTSSSWIGIAVVLILVIIGSGYYFFIKE